MKTIDVVLPVHNAYQFLVPCVESIYAYTKDFRLIIVDEDSTEPKVKEYCDYLVGYYPDNLLVRTGKQKWFTRASNIGLQLSRSEDVVLINSDTVCAMGWLDELFAARESFLSNGAREINKGVAIVGSVWSNESPLRYQETFYNREPNYVTGHCLLLNRKAFEDLSTRRGTPGLWFNELEQSQIHINSDRIACYDLNKLGYSTLISYKSHVEHHGGKSWNYDLGTVGQLKLSDVD